MAQPYVGEIRMFAGNFAPAGWMFCEGQLLPISRERDAVPADRHDLRRRRREHVRAARPARPRPDPPGQRLHPGRDRRRRGDHADGQPDRRPTRIRSLATTESGHAADIRRATCWRRRTAVDHLLAAQSPTQSHWPPAVDRAGRRQPAAHQLPAVPVRRLHHLAVRDLPVADLEETRMADPFVAEIRIFPFNFAPRGWAWCDGQLLPLSQNTALFSLLGTTYGGDGKSQLRAARPAGPRADAPGPGPGPVAARPRRDGRQRDGHAARVGDPVAQPRAAARASDRQPARRPSPANDSLADASGRQRLCTQRRRQPRLDGARGARRPPAATSRTTTCSRT